MDVLHKWNNEEVEEGRRRVEIILFVWSCGYVWNIEKGERSGQAGFVDRGRWIRVDMWICGFCTC